VGHDGQAEQLGAGHEAIGQRLDVVADGLQADLTQQRV
jgi:hypothetical protein